MDRRKDSIIDAPSMQRVEQSGVRFTAHARLFSPPKASTPDLKSSQPPAQCVSGGLSMRVKQSGRGADSSTPPRVEVTDE
jgi:hypothetical protein